MYCLINSPLKWGKDGCSKGFGVLPRFWSKMWKFIRPFMKSLLKNELENRKLKKRALLPLFYCLCSDICRKKYQIWDQVACGDCIVLTYRLKIIGKFKKSINAKKYLSYFCLVYSEIEEEQTLFCIILEFYSLCKSSLL